MEFSIFTLIAAFLIRLVGLYFAISRVGYVVIQKSNLVMLAIFATFLGFVMPAGGIFDITGILFRIALFTIILLVLLGMDPFSAFFTTIVAAVIEAIIIIVLLFTPFAPYISGLSPLMVP